MFPFNNNVYGLSQYFASQKIINRLANKLNATDCRVGRLALFYLHAADMSPSATLSRGGQFSVQSSVSYSCEFSTFTRKNILASENLR